MKVPLPVYGKSRFHMKVAFPVYGKSRFQNGPLHFEHIKKLSIFKALLSLKRNYYMKVKGKYLHFPKYWFKLIIQYFLSCKVGFIFKMFYSAIADINFNLKLILGAQNLI